VEEVGIVTLLEVVEHGGLVEVTELAHVLHAIELGRVDAEEVLLVLGLRLLL
jgi:hypothetical protein